ncbi:MAG: hypothetical protein DRJ40_11350 [Thermoprotei archaeon]|nr:MAG: hypothetical protein DRJ40_11350 [Thermoprotei archaeon]
MAHRDVTRPLKPRPEINFAIPSSVVSEAPGLREKTRKIGYIGRAAAIFRVTEVIVYRDDNPDNEYLVYLVLSYMEVPPYMKKALCPRSNLLKYVGLLPPLKTPHHVWPHVFNTKFREGVVKEARGSYSVIDVGLEKPAIVQQRLQIGSRVTVKLVRDEGRFYVADLASRDDVDLYWGYVVTRYSSMKSMIEDTRKRYDLVIGASKKGKLVNELEDELTKRFREISKVLVVFGGPRKDIDEIASSEGFNLSKYCDYILNFIPRQGTESVRTEEAIYAVMSILNYLREKATQQ